jgi:hypothetical protein
MFSNVAFLKQRSFLLDEQDTGVGGVADIVEKTSVIIAGVALTAGGIFLTISTIGLAAPVGGALVGAGISSTYHGIEKAINKERIDAISYCADVGFGAITGAATGGIGAVGETVATHVLKQGAKEVAKAGVKKLAVRAAAGAVSGVVSKAIDEVKQCSTNDKKWSDYGKSFDKDGNADGTATAWITSGFLGGLGGASSHLSSNLAKEASNGVTKSVTRVAVSGTTAALSDATIQGANIAVGNQDHYDIRQTITSATTSTIMTAAQEGTKNVIYGSAGGKNNMLVDKPNKKAMEKIPEQDRQAAMDGLEKLKQLSQQTLNDGRHTAEIRTDLNEVHNTQEAKMRSYDTKIKQVRTLRDDAKKKGDIIKAKEYSKEHQKLKTMRKEAGQNLARTEQQIGQHPTQYMNEDSAHFLDNAKFGQVAYDINQPNSATRGENRVIVDYAKDNNRRGIFLYSDHTSTHDYTNTRGFGEGDCYNNYIRHTNVIKATNGVVNNFMSNDALKRKQRENSDT